MSIDTISQEYCDYSISELEAKTIEITSLSRQNLDSAYNLALQLEACFTSGSNPIKISQAKLCLGDVHARRGDYDKAIEKFSAILTMVQGTKFVEYEIQALYSLGHAYSLKGNLPLSLKYYLASSDLAHKQNDVELIVETNLQLTEYYRKSEDFEKALECLSEVRQLLNHNQLDLIYEIRMLNRYASVWTETKSNFDSIVIFSKKSLELAQSIGDYHSQALAYNELGARSEYFSVEERVEFYEKARNIWSDLGYFRHEALPTMHLVNLWYAPQNKNQEIKDLLTPLVDQLPNNSWEKDVLLKQLSGTYEKMGNYKLALDIERARFSTVSEAMNELTKNQLEELTLNYEVRKTEEELAEKSKDLVIEKAEKNFFILLFLALLVLSILVILFFIINYRKNIRLTLQRKEIVIQRDALEGLLKEKEVLLKEVNHRVKNNMLMVSSILELQQETASDQVLKQNLQTGVDRVRSLAYAHQQLYQMENYTDIELNSYLKTIGENLLIDCEINFDLKFERLYHFTIERAQAIGFVINELITNSIKHAWNDSNEITQKKINIHFSENETHLKVDYSDNGVGLNEGQQIQSSSSLGLTLINSFVDRQLEGEISFKNSNGTQIQFTCKKN